MLKRIRQAFGLRDGLAEKDMEKQMQTERGLGKPGLFRA